MGARDKLNGAYFTGAVLTAGALALVAGSPFVFVVATTVLLASSLASGDIRLKGPRDRNKH